MFVLDWTAYPFICLSVALPMAVFYVIERRRENRADAAYDGPCMAHTGTDTDGTELWCWQISGHEGPHDEPEDTTWLDELAQSLPEIRFDPELTQSHWTPGTDEV